MHNPPRVLVLCYGNVNRSPLCAAVLRERGYSTARSAGFYKAGQRAAKKTRELAANEYELDLSQHRSSLCTHEMVHWADFIICMGYRVRALLFQQFPCSALKVITWNIPDPGFLSGKDPKFAAIQDRVVTATLEFMKWIRHTSTKQSRSAPRSSKH